MPITTELRKNIAEARPFYAIAGALDLGVEKLRTTSTLVAKATDRREIEDRATRVQADLVALPQRLETAVTVAAEGVDEAYDDLVRRGRRLVQRIRRQQSTQVLEERTKTAVSRTKAARTTARKSAASTAGSARQTARRTARTAGESAATTGRTARRSTRSTTSAVKGAATSATKAGDAAVEAVQDAARKVGD